MAFDPLSVTVDRVPVSPQAVNAESAAASARIAEDRALLRDALPDVLSSDAFVFSELPIGSATYATVHDGVGSLLQRLALFERVYVYMPFRLEDFEGWVGAPLAEFLEALPSGRIIPVFGQQPERYPNGLMSRVLDAGAPRVILQGELALRMARALRAEHPALAMVHSDAGRELRAALADATDQRSIWFRRYLDAVAGVAGDLPRVAVNGESLSNAVHPLAEWVDSIRAEVGHPSRELELSGAFEHRAINEAVRGVPMVQGG